MDHRGARSAVFHFRNRTLILLASPPIVILALSRILANIRSGQPWLNWLAGLILWLFLFIVALRRRLVLDEQGLEYTEFFSTAHIPWSQVARIVSRRTAGIWRVEGLEACTASPSPNDLFIDLTQFSKSWRQDALGAILRERAPRLFQEAPRSQSPA